MKYGTVIRILLILLLLSALASIYWCWQYMSYAREFRSLQAQVVAINGRTGAINSLVNDLVEYSKKNSDIDPILQAAGIKQKPGQTAPAQPVAPKPAGK